MSHHRTTTSTTHIHTPRQRSYVVTIDAGTFANIEIVIEGGRYHRRGVWPPPSIPRASTGIRSESSSHGHGYKFGYGAFAALISLYAHRLKVIDDSLLLPPPILTGNSIRIGFRSRTTTDDSSDVAGKADFVYAATFTATVHVGWEIPIRRYSKQSRVRMGPCGIATPHG
jgi:hypothetical protein